MGIELPIMQLPSLKPMLGTLNLQFDPEVTAASPHRPTCSDGAVGSGGHQKLEWVSLRHFGDAEGSTRIVRALEFGWLQSGYRYRSLFSVLESAAHSLM